MGAPRMKSKTGPVVLIVAGGLLLTGPLWGLIGTLLGMVHAFSALGARGPASPDDLSNSIGQVLMSTVAGFLAWPFGIALLVPGLFWLARIRREGQAPTPPR